MLIVVFVVLAILALLCFSKKVRDLTLKLLRLPLKIFKKHKKIKNEKEDNNSSEEIKPDEDEKKETGNLSMFGYDEPTANTNVDFNFEDEPTKDVIESEYFDDLNSGGQSGEISFDDYADASGSDEYRKVLDSYYDTSDDEGIEIPRYAQPISAYSDFDDDLPVKIDDASNADSIERNNFDNQSLYDLFNELPKEMKILLVAEVLKKRSDT